jgi:hypothetical protein
MIRLITLLLLTSCASTVVVEGPKKLPEFQRSQFVHSCIQQFPITICECFEDGMLSFPSANPQQIVGKCVEDFKAAHPELMPPKKEGMTL